MYRGKLIAVVIPAYNEDFLIRKTISTVPDFVDYIVVVNDASSDLTSQEINEAAIADKRVVYLSHSSNRGVGGAIGTGYLWCRDHDLEIAAVMAADNQMDPADLPALLDPIVEDRADYSKGNRLCYKLSWKIIPPTRYLGIIALTFITRIISGYWHLKDAQSGYTAVNKKILKQIPLGDIYPRYGMPNDFLVTLSMNRMRVIEVPIRPVYNVGEKSGIRLSRDSFALAWLMFRLCLRKIAWKFNK